MPAAKPASNPVKPSTTSTNISKPSTSTPSNPMKSSTTSTNISKPTPRISSSVSKPSTSTPSNPMKVEEVSVGRPKLDLAEYKQVSIDDQMRISKEHNRKSAEEKKAANKAAMGDTKKSAPKKDTRTDAEKMTDATGPRKGSNYRGD